MLVKMEVMESFEKMSFSTEGRESIISRFTIATESSVFYEGRERSLPRFSLALCHERLLCHSGWSP